MRNNLLLQSYNHPELIDAYKTEANSDVDKYFDQFIPYPRDKVEFKEFGQINNYKYLIACDGFISDFNRPMLTLYSDAVPIIVESEYSPLYVESWVPYVHYVPVQSDLSNLLDVVIWLQNHDEEAKIIANNGKNLFEKLYS